MLCLLGNKQMDNAIDDILEECRSFADEESSTENEENQARVRKGVIPTQKKICRPVVLSIA